MAKINRKFEFQTPLNIEPSVFNRKTEFLGNITIKGIAYPPTQEEPVNFDIDDVLLDNGTSVYGLLRWLGAGNIKDVDQIFYPAADHAKKLFDPYEEDRYTDLQQDDLIERRA
jgi:hypothetical protein